MPPSSNLCRIIASFLMVLRVGWASWPRSHGPSASLPAENYGETQSFALPVCPAGSTLKSSMVLIPHPFEVLSRAKAQPLAASGCEGFRLAQPRRLRQSVREVVSPLIAEFFRGRSIFRRHCLCY